MLEMLRDIAMEIAVCIGLVTFGCVFTLVFSSRRIKTGVKTLVFLLSSETVAGLLCWLSLTTYRSGNTAGGIVCLAVTAALAVGFLIGAVYGHRKGWKQDLDQAA